MNPHLHQYVTLGHSFCSRLIHIHG
jgi:hypothetical protein